MPELDPALGVFWDAFKQLTPSRYISGMGEAPIPIAEILAHCKIMEIQGRNRERMVRFIRAMEGVYADRPKEDSGKQGKKKGAPK